MLSCKSQEKPRHGMYFVSTNAAPGAHYSEQQPLFASTVHLSTARHHTSLSSRVLSAARSETCESASRSHAAFIGLVYLGVVARDGHDKRQSDGGTCAVGRADLAFVNKRGMDYSTIVHFSDKETLTVWRCEAPTYPAGYSSSQKSEKYGRQETNRKKRPLEALKRACSQSSGHFLPGPEALEVAKQTRVNEVCHCEELVQIILHRRTRLFAQAFSQAPTTVISIN